MNANDGNGSQVLESTCTRVWAWRYRSGEESKFFLTYKGELEVSGSKKSSLWRHIHQGLLPVCCESVKFCGWNGIFDRDGRRQTNLVDYVITVRTPSHTISKMMWTSTQKISLCIHTAASLVSFGCSKKPTIYSLPTELICEIFIYLDVQGLCSVKLVCPYLYMHDT